MRTEEMMRMLLVLLVCCMLVGLTRAGCRENTYCRGQVMPHKTEVNGMQVRCNTVPTPKKQCCLPQAHHVVCYNILVDGKFLNYDRDTPRKTTDFSGLCKEIATSMGHQYGKYSAATLDAGGGYLMFQYGEYKKLRHPSDMHIKDLACEIVNAEDKRQHKFLHSFYGAHEYNRHRRQAHARVVDG